MRPTIHDKRRSFPRAWGHQAAGTAAARRQRPSVSSRRLDAYRHFFAASVRRARVPRARTGPIPRRVPWTRGLGQCDVPSSSARLEQGAWRLVAGILRAGESSDHRRHRDRVARRRRHALGGVHREPARRRSSSLAHGHRVSRLGGHRVVGLDRSAAHQPRLSADARSLLAPLRRHRPGGATSARQAPRRRDGRRHRGLGPPPVSASVSAAARHGGW